MIQGSFIDAVLKYCPNRDRADNRWTEVKTRYSEADRYYHTLVHLENLLGELTPHKQSFTNWDTLVFALAYHDIIYNSLRADNEAKSAEVAVKRLTEINFPEHEIDRCEQMILATKKHEAADAETNLFTDADLSILGADPETYRTYTQQIRREYNLYPDFLYNRGRKKVLQHFLSMSSIYKTESFREKYGASARRNIQNELESFK